MVFVLMKYICRKGVKQKKKNEMHQIFSSRQFLILRVQKAAGNKQKEKFVLTANQIQNVELSARWSHKGTQTKTKSTRTLTCL